MGYEIVLSYYEEIEGSEGEYNRDETKTMKKRIGDPYEEVSLDRCAGAILAQLARRDIWVKDVEVFEVSKKKIAYKASKGSIVLKNKKYRMDGSAEIISQEIQEAPPQQQPPTQALVLATPSQVPSPMAGGHPHNRGVLKPIKWVMFQPSYSNDDAAMKQKLKLLRFTVEKKYPVFAEQLQANQVGMAYRTIDDTGREQLVSDEYFVPADAQLLMDRELKFSETPGERDGGTLQWGGAVREDNMPKLR
jgi:hypothetical protein